jgi:hypothetical protein
MSSDDAASATVGAHTSFPGVEGRLRMNILPGTGPGRNSRESSARYSMKASRVDFATDAAENARSASTI